MKKDKVLVIGAAGQIGCELVEELINRIDEDSVFSADIKPDSIPSQFENKIRLDVLDKNALYKVIKEHKINQVYLLAALLSATAEQKPITAWNLNMTGLFNVLDLAKEGVIDKVFWPSSIAIFGPSTPKYNAPQQTITEPTTVYGVSKLAGERWCEYYHNKFGVDVRSIRYPGLISYKSLPGGGTTDYAVHIFHEALKSKKYTSFLNSNTELPMMYMPDAINATIRIMEADAHEVKVRSSYNLAGFSFTPAEIAQEIKKHIPEFEIDYVPDFRQAIADSWPASINDAQAQQDWGWKPEYTLNRMVQEILEVISVLQ